MEINAELVKNHRTNRSWTQQHLADACGVSLRTIQRVERYGNASNETVMALAAVYQIEQNEITVPETAVQEIQSDQSALITRIISFMATLASGMVIGASLVMLFK